MNPSKNQIIAILLLNLFMLSASISGVIRWYDVSTLKLSATLFSSATFLFFILVVLKRYYKLFIQ
ncbi:hypothetical protein SNE25_29690 [Mucilaginibacter sabulilitoris]|uniref:Uncharacterized protein n=1 Tax=Mucilaginibacter sabulilitoris TaxID=1173583 RepID=A0ABZ0TKB5_9SPHI|nr:hypothetical protein [Mucilaginibacter sabulilitoris]WPU93493.1 hypothetical protein SNE25_29690 [Mucilaginibacter sabulilitoris]